MKVTKVLLPATFNKPVFKSDRSVRLEFETRELNGAEVGTLTDLRQLEGWLVFSANDDIDEKDIPDERADPMLGTKTQAQRLRGVIYKLWEKEGSKSDFEIYYRVRMERLIDQFKEKLE